MSLWGSKKKKDDQEDHEEGAENGEAGDMSRRSAESNRREPHERDRLLPSNPRNPPHSDGYLDPDDPAVSEQKHSMISIRNTVY